MAKNIFDEITVALVLDLFPPFPIVLMTTCTNIITVAG